MESAANGLRGIERCMMLLLIPLTLIMLLLAWIGSTSAGNPQAYFSLVGGLQLVVGATGAVVWGMACIATQQMTRVSWVIFGTAFLIIANGIACKCWAWWAI